MQSKELGVDVKEINEIVESVSKRSKPRATIYLNEKRVDEFYNQCAGAIAELVQSGKLGSKVPASLGVVRGEVGGGTCVPEMP